jgi:hypothetical protein
MEKILYQIIIILYPFLLVSCNINEEAVVRQVCENIITDFGDNNDDAPKLYLEASEVAIKNDSVIYSIQFNYWQKGMTLVEYTSYFKKNGFYVFIQQKGKERKYISINIQEELRAFPNAGEGGYFIDGSAFVLIINRKNYGYRIIQKDFG